VHRGLRTSPSGYGSQTTPYGKAAIVLTILLIIIVLLLLFGGGWGYSRRGRRI
jgi:4-hydroxybenzoate polyprenyltransferase